MSPEQARALLRALCFARVIARGETPIHVRTPDGVIRAALPHPPLPRGKVRLDCGHERYDATSGHHAPLEIGERVVCEQCVQLAEAP